VLRKFVERRFNLFVRRYAHKTALERHHMPAVPAEEAWHLFETRMLVPGARGEKRYKDWLFARVEVSSDPALQVLQSGATLVVRDAARDYLRREFPRRRSVSLSAPVFGSENGSATVEDFLAAPVDPCESVVAREYGRLARSHADRIFVGMTHRERIAVAAKQAGVSLASRAVEKAVGRRRSVINDAYVRFVRRAGQEIATAYPDEGRKEVIGLVVLTMGEIKESVFRWLKSEKRYAVFFKEVEGYGLR
jgi:hypothetical protein